MLEYLNLNKYSSTSEKYTGYGFVLLRQNGVLFTGF